MRTSKVTPRSLLGDVLLLDEERRFVALASESTRRRVARYGRELVRLGEDLQKLAAAPELRPRAAGARRLVH